VGVMWAATYGARSDIPRAWDQKPAKGHHVLPLANVQFRKVRSPLV
jgi:hypothetical protein